MSSLEETRPEFNPGQSAIKLEIDVHQHFYVAASMFFFHRIELIK